MFFDLPHRVTYNRRGRRLAIYLLSDKLYADQADDSLIIDCMSIPVCKIAREQSSTVCCGEIRDEVKARKGKNIIMNVWYIDYKLHIITSRTAIYRDILISGANLHDKYFLKLIGSEACH